MPWGVAAAAAATVVGGAIQANAAKKAAGAQGRAAETSLQEQQRQFDVSREDLAPYRNVGGAAVNRLGDLLGLGGGESLVSRPGTPSFASTGAAGGSLVDTSTGVPTYNRALYESDPIYRQAWDQHLANHQAQYGMGYTGASNPEALELGLRDLMSKERLARGMPTLEQEEAAKLEAARADPLYGSLNRKFTMEDFENDPVRKASFDFGLAEGTKAIDNRLRATGMYKSGAAAKELSRYASDYAGQQANASYGRFYADQDRTFNRLAGVSGTGQTATTNTAQLGAQAATNAGNIMVGEANARGAASIAQGNAYSNALGQTANAYQRQQMFNQYFGGGSAPSGGGSGGSSLTGGYVSDDYRWSS